MDPGRFPTQPQQASGQAVTGQPRPHPTPTPPNPPQVPGTQSMMAPMMNIPTISYYQPAQQQVIIHIISGLSIFVLILIFILDLPSEFTKAGEEPSKNR